MRAYERNLNKKCFLCNRKLYRKRYFRQTFLKQPVCKRCRDKYKKMLDEAEELEKREDNKKYCIICDTIINSGDVCSFCFADIANECMLLGTLPRKVKTWELERANKKWRKVKKIRIKLRSRIKV